MNNYYGQSWQPDARPSDSLPLTVVNSFLQRVFTTMTIGLALTGLSAWYFFNLFFISDASGDLAATPLFIDLFSGIMRWVIMLAPLAFVLVLTFGIQRLSYTAAGLLFGLYSLVMGLSLSVIFAVYTTGSIASVFFITAGTFAAMAIYGATTKTDLSKLGSVLMMALFGIIIASLVNFFLHSSTLDWVISVIGVLVFTALTAYDTQKIMRLSLTVNADTEEANKASIIGALSLYLDFVNLFLFLLRLLGNRR